MYPAVTKGASGIFLTAVLKTRSDTAMNRIPARHAEIKTAAVLKNPRLKARTAAIFMSAFPSPFVRTATAKNKAKNRTAQESLAGIACGSVRKVKKIESTENPSVIEFGMRYVRMSQNEMTARYERQRIFGIIRKLPALHYTHVPKKKANPF